MPRMTAKRLREQADAYFDGRRVTRPLKITVPVFAQDDDGRVKPVLDQYGHQQMEQVVAENAAGEPVMETVWFSPPTIPGLCLAAGINKSTFYRWLRIRDDDSPERVRLRQAAMDVEAVIEDYLTQKSFEKTAGRGAIAQLERNYWRGETPDDNAGAQAPKLPTMAEMEEQLRAMGLRLPGEEDNV